MSVLINLFFNLFLLIGHFGGISLAFWYDSWCSQTKTHSVAKPKHTKMLQILKCCKMLRNTARHSETSSKMLQNSPKCSKKWRNILKQQQILLQVSLKLTISLIKVHQYLSFFSSLSLSAFCNRAHLHTICFSSFTFSTFSVRAAASQIYLSVS